MKDITVDLDYIIFSSHKTGTQTLVETLSTSGYKAIHFHTLEGVNATVSTFRQYLYSYIKKHGRKAKIVSTFRLPIERHISSFFQWYGDGVLRYVPDFSIDDTVISQIGIKSLNALFISDLATGKLKGYEDSLNQLFNVLEIEPKLIQ